MPKRTTQGKPAKRPAVLSPATGPVRIIDQPAAPAIVVEASALLRKAARAEARERARQAAAVVAERARRRRLAREFEGHREEGLL